MVPSKRFLFVATADARGHLMRTQLLYHGLRKKGIAVQVLTTSESGAAFLAKFGIHAPVISSHYSVLFDSAQNMRQLATDLRIAAYVLLPWRMIRDISVLSVLFKQVDIVINDSFHPALLVMGVFAPWRKKIVHVYGSSLRLALENNFSGRIFKPIARLFSSAVSWAINRAMGRIEHDFTYASSYKEEQVINNSFFFANAYRDTRTNNK